MKIFQPNISKNLFFVLGLALIINIGVYAANTLSDNNEIEQKDKTLNKVNFEDYPSFDENDIKDAPTVDPTITEESDIQDYIFNIS